MDMKCYKIKENRSENSFNEAKVAAEKDRVIYFDEQNMETTDGQNDNRRKPTITFPGIDTENMKYIRFVGEFIRWLKENGPEVLLKEEDRKD